MPPDRETSSRRTDWRTISLLAAMYAVLIGNFTLYWSSPSLVVVHVLFSTVAIHLAFTVWHEGVHQTVSKTSWINDSVGILGVFPYMAPFYVEKWFHLQHHAMMNRPDDPNFIYLDGPLWQMPLRYLRVLRYARERMRDDPRTERQKIADRIPMLGVVCIYGIALWQGVFLDVVLLWFIPVVLSKLVMDWYVNYLPHVGLPPNRFQGTRIIDIGWLTVALLGHNYHAVHHLWPSLPWHRYRATFVDKLDYLREHGVPIQTRISAAQPGTAELSARILSLVDTHCGVCGADDFAFEASGVDFEYDTADNEFHFVRCAACDHRYLNPRPSSDDLGVIYPENYYAYEADGSGLVATLRRRWEGGKVRLYRELVGAGPRRLLDVGCGNGRFLSLLRDFGPGEWDLVGIDFDAAAARQCAEKGFETHVARVEDFDASDASFDGVVMLQLIEHVDDPGAICERVFALLRPGGCFIIETPNLAGVDYRLFRGSWWGHYHFPRHWNLFSTRALHRLLEERGFEIERCEYLISTSAWTISFHNYFLDRKFPDWFVRFFHFKNPLLLGIFVIVDSLRARLGFQTSNQRVVARKPRA